MMKAMSYCPSIYQTIRRKTREVRIGCVGVGGENPIRIQSMTTTNTRDVNATVQQIMQLADQGCEIARVTVQGKKEALACQEIKNTLIQKGYDIPLVADIHFYPPAAMEVVEYVDKVRINPGNFLDKRATFKQVEYSDQAYAEELKRIEDQFSPFIEKCKKYQKAIRIGTNHGSLSDRIMSRFGDTPEAMVISALEYTHICRRLDFHDIVFSMKASIPQIMIHAYRRLVAKMMELGWDYPIHLGVTEAGSGEDGRVKSSVGIGTLLLDGIGDTIRVSLTEDPVAEIDPCRRLIALANSYQGQKARAFEETHRAPFSFQKRASNRNTVSFLHQDGSVGLVVDEVASEEDLGLTDKHRKVDFILSHKQSSLNCRCISKEDPGLLIIDEDESTWDLILQKKPKLILFSPSKGARVQKTRLFFQWLQDHDCDLPVILYFTYDLDEADVVIWASAECGSILADGFGDGVIIDGSHLLSFLRKLGFQILQSVRMRATQTEFISCPGCGRTLFDLQEVTKKIQERTSHLPGVKIAVMGCIVNGPGEMADSDFGYVGSGPEKIDLYVGKTCVERGVHHHHAVEKLIDLIKAHGRWIEQEHEVVF